MNFIKTIYSDENFTKAKEANKENDQGSKD